MSSICLCATNLMFTRELSVCQRLLNKVATKHNRGIQFNVDWKEPIVEKIKDSCFVMSLSDSPEKETCEMLLLPDDWYYNGMSNSAMFKDRILFLVSLAETLLKCHKSVEFYIATSGTPPCDYQEASIKIVDFVVFLENSIGRNGTEEAIHVTVLP